MADLTTDVQIFKFRGCQVCISKDAGLWHISISRKDRLPSYEELKDVRYQYLPDVPYMVQIFPSQEDFVNLHNYCLHLWEPKDPFVYSELNVDSFLATPPNPIQEEKR
jgi:hypothetical protein